MATVIFMRQFTGDYINFYLNGQEISRSESYWSNKHGIWPLAVRMPPEFLREGENTLHIHAVAYPLYLNGMPRVMIGSSAELSERIRYWRLLQYDIIATFAFALGLVGVLSLAFWAVDRTDTLLWFGISGIAFGAVSAAWYVVDAWPTFRSWFTSLVLLRHYGVITPLAILQLRLAGWRLPWLERTLWAMLACAVILMSLPWWASTLPWWVARVWIWTGFGLFYSILPVLLLFPILRARNAMRPMARVGLAVASIGVSALALHDWASKAGMLTFDNPWMIIYVAPLFMFALGAVMVEQYLAATRRQRGLTAELEARVAEKTREIEAAHAQMRAADEERALVRERRRIMADMHDGLGSRLVGLLSQVQSDKADRRQIEEGLTAALDELRTTIDSLQPVEGDLSVVLGNVRHRMRTVFESAGLELGWRVGELPRLENLTPARNLAIQRILLELFTNVLKHSRARKVEVSTRADAGRASIVIVDDGRGFDPASRHDGRGLANLQERAREAGGVLLIESEPGKGTRATLALPAAA
jgi:signal transduction histidine kinase